jgi:hypothetical protein
MSRARLLQLAEDLGAEVDALVRIETEAAQCLVDLAARSPTSLELRGAGDIVHDFYNAVERYLERVAVELHGALPAGPDSHVRLLMSMARGVDEVRPAVLRDNVQTRLTEYLRFRHLFRHRYGYQIEWPKLVPLLQGIAHLAPDLHADLVGFMRTLRALAAQLP